MDDGNENAQPDQNLPDLLFWIKLTVILFATALCVGHIRHSCHPETSPVADRFSEENTRLHLQKVTLLGPRTAGSIANEIWAANYLRDSLQDIVDLAAKYGHVNATFDEQISKYSSLRCGFHVTSYNGLRNFVLRLGSPNHSPGDRKKAFLVNCHYDSAVDTPGASDAFVNCAILLELGRQFATGLVNMSNDLIFLFNGAEENILPASHAFITQHPWANDVAAFLNLEGAGSGGRIMVFQAGPGKYSNFLLDTYASTFRQPFADVFGEGLFQSGLIPSDTDYRIFRDFALLPGLDMAFVSDGYCYHTAYDTESRISPHCLQKTGDDLLRFLTKIATDDRLQTVERLIKRPNPIFSDPNHLYSLTSANVTRVYRPEATVEISPAYRHVYFDILGHSLFLTPWWVFKYFNWLMCSIWLIWAICERTSNFSRWIGLMLAIGIQICGQILTLLFTVILGYITHTYGCRMSWYSSQYNIVGIFILPIVTCFVWINSYLFRLPKGLLNRLQPISKLCRDAHWIVQRKPKHHFIFADLFDAAQAICVIQVMIMNYFNNPMLYFACLWLTMSLIGRMFCTIFRVNLFSLSYLLITVLPTLAFFHIYGSFNLLSFIIPVMGRAGEAVYPDLVVSLITFISHAPLFLFLTGPLQCTSCKASQTMRIILLNACLSYAVLVHSSPYGFPYSVDRTLSTLNDPSLSPRFQRVGLFHSVRRFRYQVDSDQVTHEDSLMLVLPLDVNSVRYLTPGSYPPSVHSSIFSLFSPPDLSLMNKQDMYGLQELVNQSGSPCNSSQPYCGIAAIYPYLHYFKQFYQVPVEPHSSTPRINLTLVSRTIIPSSTRDASSVTWNMTFTINSGPPCTHVLVRTDKPFINLIDWSFSTNSSIPIPMPLPPPIEFVTNATSAAHYFIYHVNAAAVHSQSSAWLHPWTFWFTFDVRNHSVLPQPYFDMAVAGVYMDQNLPSSRSEQLKHFLSRLPPWTMSMSACTSYEHYRIGFH